MYDIYGTDEDLMRAVKQSDYACYGRLFERYYSRLCRYAYGLLLDKEDAEDVVQELFLTLWKNREKIEIKENAEGYLYRMAKYLALNHLRVNNRFCDLPEEPGLNVCSYEDTRVESEEFRSILYDCIGRLPDRSREVFLLHRIEGLKQKEISERLEISVQTIKNQIWASLQRLKKCLEWKGI